MGCLKDTATNRDDSLEVQRRNINADIKHAVNRDCVCVCVLTVSLFMKPQIAAATSQANRITKKKKNYKSKIFILTSVTPKIKILYLEKKVSLVDKTVYSLCPEGTEIPEWHHNIQGSPQAS